MRKLSLRNLTLRRSPQRKILIGSFAVALTAASFAVATMSNAASSAPNASQYSDGRYIVTFADDPVGTYEGYQSGFKATKPKAGKRSTPTRRR